MPYCNDGKRQGCFGWDGIDARWMTWSYIAYLCFNNSPLLACLSTKGAPDIFPHVHIFLCQVLEFDCIPIITIAAIHKSLMALSTCIGSLRGEVGCLNRLPVEALSTCLHKCGIVLRCPRTRGCTDRNCSGWRYLLILEGLDRAAGGIGWLRHALRLHGVCSRVWIFSWDFACKNCSR